MVAANNSTREREDLWADYQQRSLLEQQILQFAAILYQPTTRAELSRCLEQLQLQEEGKLANRSRLLTRIDRLRDSGLLQQNKNFLLQCTPLLRERIMGEALSSGFLATAVNQVRQHFPIRRLGLGGKSGARFFTNPDELVREVRIALYQNNFEEAFQALAEYEQRHPTFRQSLSFADVINLIFSQPLDPDWLWQLPPALLQLVLSTMLMDGMNRCQAVEIPLKLATAAYQRDRSLSLGAIILEMHLLRGELATVQELLTAIETPSPAVIAISGWLAFMSGDNDAALARYQIALDQVKKAQQKDKNATHFIADNSGYFFILALLKSQAPEHELEAEAYANLLARQEVHWLIDSYEWLNSLLQAQQGDLQERRQMLQQTLPQIADSTGLNILLTALCLYWLDPDVAAQKAPPVLKALVKRARSANYHWLALEAADLLQRLEPQPKNEAKLTHQRAEIGCVPLAESVARLETWDLCLQALTNLDSQASQQKSATLRLAWFLTYYGPTSWQLQAREQKIKANGEWGKGRQVSIKRLAHPSEFDYFTAQDIRICGCIEEYSSYDSGYYYSRWDYRFKKRALQELVGHPLVFWEDSPTSRIEIVTGEPELLVQQDQESLKISLSPAIDPESEVVAVKETPTRLKVVAIQPGHRQIAEIVGSHNALTVPLAARDRVLTAINSMSSLVAIQSDIGGGNIDVEAVEPDATPHVHLLPVGEGLRVQLLVRPFATGGPYYAPATGGETVIGDLDGRRVQTRRDLALEQQLADQVIAACPALANGETALGEWQLEEPEVCLELLLELRELGDRIMIEWPEGENLRVSAIADAGAFRMSVRQQRDWFEASGELPVDDERVLDMQQLLALLDEAPGRFLPLGDGQFLALTQSFRKRLEELRAFSEQHGKHTRLNPLAIPALADFADAIGEFEADQHWREHLRRFEEIQSLQPEVPSTLQAELRDYQIDGFRWLARLAHWGVGACLADDMGLGKTLQALAVILTRAPQGPTLVVAPTSVGTNWLSEAQRFAPTLKPLFFGTGDRQAMLNNLQPFDLVVCSYGLLQQPEVAAMMAAVEWQTIVLDEAQAIKNSETKRSQAAMQLRAGFKMIATGTPIENHLGELWNLFRFINPGLLGSQKRFNQVFAVPIERYKDKGAKAKLKKLIQPFLLRRTKSQVLDELPSRTEILLPVELSREEIALYEALRREAVKKLEETDAEAGAKHLQVLAEIMRLRRFCCNPNLVKPELELTGSKLEVFGETVEELLANRHKALVFSQFVDHLKILRDYLDTQNIRYQYLDGSTPAKVRKQRVDAFQSGDGDIFLISLKAGGTGLNLTAADYVIHMDPWWNPAVEDQASDRAHRIGQQRPVTIYRLVAQHTIEEKIVQLHQHKRDLADSLLADSDGGGKLSTNELLQLLSER
ncbi:MAG: DEAD/DEAH box helicase [Spirulinaceae cyanobacterium SM2_1_0]|nr:DEAD/DEAH box helicase [Spirulinaceae cyanobacterium SM2_1_0]